MSIRPDHWNRVYGGSKSEDLGWHQASIATLDLVVEFSTSSSAVIDVGGGDSRLIDVLLDRGYSDITVLDVSTLALARAQERLGERGHAVEWVEADITEWTPERTWDLWHDRAVFHFLTGADDRRAYVDATRAALGPGGVLVIATFAPDGPDMCAGLPVRRYDPHALVAEFSAGFEELWSGELPPAATTEGDQRPFVAAVLRRQAPG